MSTPISAERLEELVKPKTHRLSGIDETDGIATCSICGPTRIHRWGTRDGEPRYKCMNSYNDRKPDPPKREVGVQIAVVPLDTPVKTRTGVEWKSYHKYGLTDEQYQELLQAQDYRCALCGQRTKLVVDHCHETGRVRGLLCGTCNTKLGWLEGFIALPALLDYLGLDFTGGRL